MKRDRFPNFIGWYTVKSIPANHNSTLGFDKSIVDDFVASSYCKCESIPVIRSTEVFAPFLRFVLPYFIILIFARFFGNIFRFAKFVAWQSFLVGDIFCLSKFLGWWHSFLVVKVSWFGEVFF